MTLIEEFNDVFPDDLHTWLPPERDIRHLFDLASEASMPNEQAYHMNPMEFEELMRLV